MDAFAVGLKAAYKMIEDGVMDGFVDEHYASYSAGIGKDIVDGKAGLKELEAYVLGIRDVVNVSGRQELLETLLNEYILSV